MKIQNVKFTQLASTRVYADYMKRVKNAIKSLSQQNQDDIYMEFNSHIFEAINHKSQGNEIDILLDTLDRLGVPEEVLKPLVADRKLEQATQTFNPVHVFKALVLNFTNGVSYIIFAMLYLSLFILVVLIFAKIFNPEAGLFYKEGSVYALGILDPDYPDTVVEVLGDWFIPVMLVSIIVFYTFITLLLKLKKSINKKK